MPTDALHRPQHIDAGVTMTILSVRERIEREMWFLILTVVKKNCTQHFSNKQNDLQTYIIHKVIIMR